MFRNKQTQEIELHGGLVHVLPWLTAICGVLLAISTFWGWANSQDLLPSYMKFPALIGGVFCCISAIGCVVAHYFLAKGETHWDKDKHLNAPNRDLHKHPLTKWPHALVFGTTIAAVITEGSYIYMLACVLLGGEEQYCYTYSSGETKDECKGTGGAYVAMNALLLVVLAICATFFELGMQHSIGKFNKIRDQDLSEDDESATELRKSHRSKKSASKKRSRSKYQDQPPTYSKDQEAYGRDDGSDWGTEDSDLGR